jgi:hypothetical protein
MDLIFHKILNINPEVRKKTKMCTFTISIQHRNGLDWNVLLLKTQTA